MEGQTCPNFISSQFGQNYKYSTTALICQLDYRVSGLLLVLCELSTLYLLGNVSNSFFYFYFLNSMDIVGKQMCNNFCTIVM